MRPIVNGGQLPTKTIVYLDFQLYSNFVKSQCKKEPTPVDSSFRETFKNYAVAGVSLRMGDFLERTFIFFPVMIFPPTSRL